MPKPEAALQKTILDYLAVKHIWHRRMNSGAIVSEHAGKKRMFRFGSSGMADILCSLTIGYPDAEDMYCAWLWIECKAPKGKQSPAQIEFMDEVRNEGHYYVVARSLEDVIDAIKEIQG